jgi:hypothetical protein
MILAECSFDAPVMRKSKQSPLGIVARSFLAIQNVAQMKSPALAEVLGSSDR